MRKILCFGDSNTFGYRPQDGGRFDVNNRWSGILKTLLNNEFEITEAGCNNRTCFSDNPCGDEQTGYKAIKKYSNQKFDIIILSIGVNDLQFAYDNSFEDIFNGMNGFVKNVKILFPDSKIILTSPSVLTKAIYNGFFATLFDETSIEKSECLSEIYSKISKENNCVFVDLNLIAPVSDIDGLHYTADSHKKIAQNLYELIVDIN